MTNNLPREITKEEITQKHVTRLLEEIAKQPTPQAKELFLATALNSPAEQWLAAFITDNPAMKEMKNKIRKLANNDQPVLITGPSGTGKELIACALHGNKDPATFHAVNVAAVPEGLIESELFGHRQGAFTGATKDHPGILLSAADGTVFLDEIGEAPLALQAKLLRALQPDLKGRRYIRAVGAVSQQQISCRIIAATKKDLFACVLDNTFREDLYGRLMSYEIELTGLSHRPGDIPLILRHLGCDDTDDLDTPYWQKRIELMNVRALQAYALRRKLQ